MVSRRQLRALGYSEAAIGRAIGAGRLHRVQRGVYAVGHERLSSHGHCQAAVLAGGRGALLSHGSAAWLWGLQARLILPVELVVRGRGHRRDGIRLHFAPALASADEASHEGLPTTGVVRTLLDIASTESRRKLERALDRANRLGLLEVEAIDSCMARTAGHSGCGRLRKALRLHREPRFTRSALERRFLMLVRKVGLPLPAANVVVAGFELDMYWEAEAFAVELDGYEHHRGRAAFERDHRRQEDLKLAGIEMVRFTARRVFDRPDEVMRRLSLLLDNRRRELEAAGRRDRLAGLANARSTAGTG